MTSKHSQAPCMTDLITVASLPICVYVSTGAQRSGAETAGCPPPRFTLRLDFPLEKRWKSSFPLHSFFEMTCSSLWPADQQETSAAPKKHINSCTLRLRVNRFPDTGGPLCLWDVWLLLPATVRNSCFTPSSAIVLSPTCAEHQQVPLFLPSDSLLSPDIQQALLWASLCQAQEKDAEEDNSCSAGLFLTNGPVTLPID